MYIVLRVRIKYKLSDRKLTRNRNSSFLNASTTESVKSIKGQIYNAIAYKDGKNYISGEPKGEKDGAYYFSDGKYSKLKDIDSEDKAEAYGTKYVEIEDGDNYVDLSTGKVNDERVKVKAFDAAAVNLRSEVKSDNEGRYDDTDAKSVKDLTEIPNSKFRESYYTTEYKVKSSDDTVNGGAGTYTVYTDKDGKYIYAVISKSSATTAATTNTGAANTNTTIAPSTPKVVEGWERASNGSWSYNNADGTKFKGWLKSGDLWYYLETDGVMATGWESIGNKWYFMESSGIMKTGWINDSGKWYYLNTSGEMLSNTTIKGYKLGANGVWIS